MVVRGLGHKQKIGHIEKRFNNQIEQNNEIWRCAATKTTKKKTMEKLNKYPYINLDKFLFFFHSSIFI